VGKTKKTMPLRNKHCEDFQARKGDVKMDNQLLGEIICLIIVVLACWWGWGV
jgi:hypothetical protein